ncbi:MAG TPA: hypothetical protein VI072_06875 [Polyangiaceae bacterium]
MQITGRVVNGRGQILGSEVQVEDVDSIARVVDEEARARGVAALREFQIIVERAHRCVNDGGAAYRQTADDDGTALRSYIVDPWIRHAAEAVVKNKKLAAAADSVANALLTERTTRVVTWPVLGLSVSSSAEVGGGLLYRPPTSAETFSWSTDTSIELGDAKDILVCECVVECTYDSRWPARTAPIDAPVFDAQECTAAIEACEDLIALLRIATGAHLPLLFVDHVVRELPWVRTRDYLAPTVRDFSRRRDLSLLWARVESAIPTPEDLRKKVCHLWSNLRRDGCPADLRTAVRLFNRELDFITLYKIVELVPRVLKATEGSNVARFKHTANSPAAVPHLLARHARQTGAPPKSPMDIVEASQLARRLVTTWLDDVEAAGV